MILETLIFSVPEAAAIAWLICGLTGTKMDFKKIIALGVLMGFLSAAIRPLTGSYILNVIAYTSVLMALFSIFRISSFSKRLTSVLIAMSVYLMIEFLNIKAIQTIFRLDPAIIIDNIVLRFLWFIPQLTAAMLVAFLITKYNCSLFTEE